MELECPQHHRLACDQMAWITQQLETHRELLASLRHGSVDYVLHLSVHSAAFQPLRIPVQLSSLAHDCGFEIEIYLEPRADHDDA